VKQSRHILEQLESSTHTLIAPATEKEGFRSVRPGKEGQRLVVPTLITGIHGMNFEYMPEPHWLLGSRCCSFCGTGGVSVPV
jgi:hypothetical protein